SVSMLTVADSAPIYSITVDMSATHAHVADLLVQLEAPDGTFLTLADRAGGNAANFMDAGFDDSASGPIPTTLRQVTGMFLPVSQLGVLRGAAMAGTWKLWVTDKAGVRTGVLTQWSLLITPQV
ncbi:MAG: proprotein convertase P-domain-containing protein, partial [Gemmataceae bacterium]|nr:proprotein convertase P-domain-containing protein [Gemmataceae bacterium]